MQQYLLTHRLRSAAARRAVLGAAVVSAIAATPASAVVGPQGVRDGHNITVFHNIDMVAAFGSGVGEQTQVDVFRGAHHIASARGAAVDTPEGGALEVNHGPEGLPQPGDCWDGATPDIRPGDRIVVSNPGGAAGVDEAIVDNITITSRTVVQRDADTGGPVVVHPAVYSEPTPENPEPVLVTPEWTEPTRDEVWVQGTAESIDENGNATPLPVDALDSAEFLGVPDDNQLRMAPNEVIAGETAGSYIARYYDADPSRDGRGFNVDRNRNNRSDAYIFDALATGEGHAMGYGHTAVLPPVSMLVDGLEEQPTPALGCEAAPKYANSIGTTSTEVLNLANAGPEATGPVLTVGGWAAPGAAVRDLVLTGGGASVAVPVELDESATSPQGWSASFTAADLAELPEGTLTAQLRIDGALVGAKKLVRYDVTAPTFAVDLDEGTYTGTRFVRIAGGPSGDPVSYQLDGGLVREYRGVAIELGVGPHTLVVRASDAAGNAVARTLKYTIAPVPAVEEPPVVTPPVSPVEETAPVDTPPVREGSPATDEHARIASSSKPPVPAAQAPVLAPPATRATPPVATMQRGAVRIAATTARRHGLVARFTVPHGAVGAAIRVSRVRNGERTPLRTRSFTVRGGQVLVSLGAKALRRKLTPGRYVIEVTLRDASGRVGAPASTVVHVTR